VADNIKITEIGLLQAFLGGFLISAQSISVLSCCSDRIKSLPQTAPEHWCAAENCLQKKRFTGKKALKYAE
jgi:hypothetical protein